MWLKEFCERLAVEAVQRIENGEDCAQFYFTIDVNALALNHAVSSGSRLSIVYFLDRLNVPESGLNLKERVTVYQLTGEAL